MKPISLMAITAFALSGAALAQTQDYGSSSTSTTTTTTTQTQTPYGSSSDSSGMSGTSSGMSASPTTSSTTATQTPAPQVVEQKVDLTTEPGPPYDKRAARTEAINALAWAKHEGCRDDPSPRDCVRQAQEDYRETMARLGPGPTDSRSGGTVSSSGTSEAPPARADRN
jgi:hypothetical protein